jgi:hypothetical protein
MSHKDNTDTRRNRSHVPLCGDIQSLVDALTKAPDPAPGDTLPPGCGLPLPAERWACPCCGDATVESPPVLGAAQRECSRCSMSWTVLGWWTSAGTRFASGGDARAVCRRRGVHGQARPEPDAAKPTPPPAASAPPVQPWRWQRWGESAYLDGSAGSWRPGTWRPVSGIAIADAQRGRPDHRGSQRPCDVCGLRACSHPRAKAGW